MLIGLAFTLLVASAGGRFRVFRTISFPGVAITIYLLHINFWEHLVVASCLVVALNTLIYAVLFALFFGLLRFIGRRVKRA